MQSVTAAAVRSLRRLRRAGGIPSILALFAEAVQTCGPDACPGPGTARGWSTNVGLGEKEVTGRGIRESAAYWEASRVGAKLGKAE